MLMRFLLELMVLSIVPAPSSEVLSFVAMPTSQANLFHALVNSVGPGDGSRLSFKDSA